MKLVKLALAFVFVSLFALAYTPIEAHAASNDASSIHTYPSNQNFATVRQKALDFIKNKDLTLFAEFDHAENAQGVNMPLEATTVLIFGNPKVGTKLMQEFPGIGIVLPLGILIMQGEDGKVTLSYEDLATAFAPFGVKKDNPILLKMQGLLKALAETATK